MKKFLLFFISLVFMISHFACNSETVGQVNVESSVSGNWKHTATTLNANHNTIYIGTLNNKLFALNNNGTQKWAYNTNSISNSSPTVDGDGIIYLGTMDGKLHAVYQDGTQKWVYDTGIWALYKPLIGTNGIIYVFSIKGNLYLFNKNGNLISEKVIDHMVFNDPTISSDGTIAVSTADGKLRTFHSDGSPKWVYDTETLTTSPIIDNDGTIYVGAYNQYLYASNSDGTLKRKVETQNYYTAIPVMGIDGTVYCGNVLGLYAVNSNGDKNWFYSFLENQISSLSDSSGDTGFREIIYTILNDNILIALYSNGTEKWRFSLGASNFSKPTVASDGTIYVANKFKVFAINPNGTTKWVFEDSA